MALLLARMLTTVFVESIFFLCVGLRSRDFLVVCVLINAITNLALNLTLWALAVPLGSSPQYSLVAALLLELTAAAVEYLVYRSFLRSQIGSLRLLLHTAVANVLSFGAGFLLETFSI